MGSYFLATEILIKAFSEPLFKNPVYLLEESITNLAFAITPEV